MRILHAADVHLGDLSGPVIGGKNARRQDTLECMEAIVHEARLCAIKSEPYHVAIIAGDLFNRSRVWADTALEDITDAIETLLRPLCHSCEHVILLFGTDNHDNPRAFEVLAQTMQSETNLHILTRPGVFTYGTSDGEIQILALPGFDKGRLRTFTPDADKETENRNATALINDVLLGLSIELDKNKPSILVAHYTVAGCETESGSTFLAGQDVCLLPQTIDATGVTLATLGHIHRPQRLNSNTPAYYSGSINQLTFGDENDTHGFYMHLLGQEYGMGDEPEWVVMDSEFIETPERRHMTLRYSQEEIAHFIQTGTLPELLTGSYNFYLGCIVRVRYKATAEQDKALNKAELQKQLMSRGAFHVAEILADDLDDGVTSYEETSDDTPAAALTRYFDMAGVDPADAARLTELALPLIQKADDGRDADQHTGAFVPRRIEAKNYRSYVEASFDFEDIRMAMVNGSNGVGKSSLFMDAIADALYEESRDGQLGGWLREGEKSGSVSFEFDMGSAGYRVARTRTKSGKGTLGFSRRNDSGEWEDCGDTTMKLTQAKIEQTLGMDMQTFCSIALIRQDAYGIFLEADSDRRMEVLSALLNLGIYVRLEGLAKDEASEQRRRIAQVKDRMNLLSDQIATKETIETDARTLQELIDRIAGELQTLDDRIAAGQREEALRQEVMNQAAAKSLEAQTLTAEVVRKTDELTELISQQKEEESLAAMKGDAEKAASIVAAARGYLELLAPAESDLRSLNEKRASLLTARTNAENSLNTITLNKTTHNEILAQRGEIERAITALDEIAIKRADVDARSEEYADKRQRVNTLEAEQKAFVAESRARLGAIATNIDAAQGKTALLNDSKCPIPDEATCAFLKDAHEAVGQIVILQDELLKGRTADRIEYDRINAILLAAQAEFEALTNPKEERDELMAQEIAMKPKAALSPKLEAAAASISELEKQELKLREAIVTTDVEMVEVVRGIPELEEKAKKAAEQRAEITKHEPTANMLSKCTAAQATIDALTKRIAALQTDIDGLKLKAEATASEAETIRARIPKATVDLSMLESQRKETAGKQNDALSQLGGIETRLESVMEAQRQHDAYADEVKAVARSLNDYQSLAQAFGIDGIQYMIIRSVVPEIMRRANDILAAMTGGRMAVDIRTEREQRSSSKIVNSLDVWINSISSGSRPYSSHSGGEKVRVALAVTLALADVKARRVGVQLGMIQIDEPPYLDQEGASSYTDALLALSQRNPQMRILAISHDPQFKAAFPQNITIDKVDGASFVASYEK